MPFPEKPIQVDTLNNVLALSAALTSSRFVSNEGVGLDSCNIVFVRRLGEIRPRGTVSGSW